MYNLPRPLAIFLRSHCTYLSDTALLGLNTPSQQQSSQPLNCPICFLSLSSTEYPLQVNLPECTHIFCADCVSRHVLAGYSTCPLCRAQWFDVPPGATTAVTAMREAEDRIMALEDMVGIPMLDAEVTEMRRAVAESEDSRLQLSLPSTAESGEFGSQPNSALTAVSSSSGRSSTQLVDERGEMGGLTRRLISVETLAEWRRQQTTGREVGRALDWSDSDEDYSSSSSSSSSDGESIRGNARGIGRSRM